MPPKLPPKKPSFREQAKVLFNYVAQNEDELTIKEGDIITIITKKNEDEGWWEGELNGKIGVFPDNFVEVIKVNQKNNLINGQTQNVNTNVLKNASNSSLNKTTTGILDENDVQKLISIAKKYNTENKLTKVFSSLTGNGKNSDRTSKSSLMSVENKNTNLNKSSDELNKFNGNNNPAPTLPVKKIKLFGTNKVSKNENDNTNLDEPSSETSETDLNSIIDTQQNIVKLKNLTAGRVKGPKDRRPPSIIQLPKEDNDSLPNNLEDLSSLHEKVLNRNIDTENEENINLSSKETSRQNSRSNSSNDMLKQAPTNSNQTQTVPPWMVELKKTQEKKNEVRKKNLSLTEDPQSNLIVNNVTSSSNIINSTVGKFSTPSPSSPTKSTPSHRMSGDFTQRFKDFNQQQTLMNTNSLSRHTSLNNTNVLNSNRTLSIDSIDNKSDNQTSVAGFGNLAVTNNPYPPTSIKPAKAIKPTTKLISGSPTNNASSSNQNKDNLVSKKEFDELNKKVTHLTEALEIQKQSFKILMKDLINDLAEEKKKLANLMIEVDRLRKLTTTV